MTQAELEAMEVADFGLSKLEETGLEIVVYVNTERVCAKELVMFPRQLCPEHRHPPFDGTPGKEETFRCRAGTVYLYTPGRARRRSLRPASPQTASSRCGTKSCWRPGAVHDGPTRCTGSRPGTRARSFRSSRPEPGRARHFLRPAHPAYNDYGRRLSRLQQSQHMHVSLGIRGRNQVPLHRSFRRRHYR